MGARGISSISKTLCVRTDVFVDRFVEFSSSEPPFISKNAAGNGGMSGIVDVGLEVLVLGAALEALCGAVL
jgi:hypothetical protein